MSTTTITLLLLLLFTLSLLHHSNSSSHPTISISTNILRKSGSEIHIKWSNITSPSRLDWLGIYSPSSSSNDNFIGYIFLSSSPSWQSGSGNLTFPLVNLRSDYEFRIFRWTEDEIDMRFQDHDHNPLPGTAHLLLKSGLVKFKKGLGPEQVHLTYTEWDDEMRVMFVSDDGGECFVKYGVNEELMEFTGETKVGRYEREDMCDSPANESVGWRDPGFVHDGVMVDLMKGKRYFYKVGSDSGGWSKVYSFVSRNSDSDETIGFLFGDMGTATPYSTFLRTQDESITTVKWILRDIEGLGDKPAFVSHIGDISYARGYSWLWDTFFNLVEPVASQVPYHVCIGNHEYDWPSQPWKPDWSSSIYGKDGGGECGVPYSVKFNMPGKYAEPTGTSSPATRNLFYSFDKGAVHFVYISTETNFLQGSPQFKFLSHDLKSVDRTKTPFVVVQGHRPMYTTSNDKKGVPLRAKMIEHLEPLFVKYNVNLAFWGHVHRYERFCPLNNFTCGEFADGWPIHVVIGMAGQDWQPVWQPRDDHPNDPVFPQPKHSMYRGSVFGYTKLIATKAKLTLSYIGNHDGQVHDTLEILASGQVSNVVIKYEQPQVKNEDKVVESTFSWYVKGSSVLVLGAFMGYVLGFISHAKKEAISRKKWAPLKSDAV